MAPATDSPRSEAPDLALRWSGQISLTQRILAINIFALLLLAGGFFYLDSYRTGCSTTGSRSRCAKCG